MYVTYLRSTPSRLNLSSTWSCAVETDSSTSWPLGQLDYGPLTDHKCLEVCMPLQQTLGESCFSLGDRNAMLRPVGGQTQPIEWQILENSPWATKQKFITGGSWIFHELTHHGWRGRWDRWAAGGRHWWPPRRPLLDQSAACFPCVAKGWILPHWPPCFWRISALLPACAAWNGVPDQLRRASSHEKAQEGVREQVPTRSVAQLFQARTGTVSRNTASQLTLESPPQLLYQRWSGTLWGLLNVRGSNAGIILTADSHDGGNPEIRWKLSFSDTVAMCHASYSTLVNVFFFFFWVTWSRQYLSRR